MYSQYTLQLIVIVSQDISTSKWKGTGWEGIDGLGEKGQGLGEENLRDKWCYDIDRHTFGQQYDISVKILLFSSYLFLLSKFGEIKWQNLATFTKLLYVHKI